MPTGSICRPSSRSNQARVWKTTPGGVAACGRQNWAARPAASRPGALAGRIVRQALAVANAGMTAAKAERGRPGRSGSIGTGALRISGVVAGAEPLRAAAPQPQERDRSRVAAREAGAERGVFEPLSCGGRKRKRMIWLPERAAVFGGIQPSLAGEFGVGELEGAEQGTGRAWHEKSSWRAKILQGCSTGSADATQGARRLRRFTVRTSSRVRPCPHLSRSSGINAARRIPRGARGSCWVVVQGGEAAAKAERGRPGRSGDIGAGALEIGCALASAEPLRAGTPARRYPHGARGFCWAARQSDFAPLCFPV